MISLPVTIDRTSQARKNLRPCLRFIQNDEVRATLKFFPFKIEPQSISLLLQIEILAIQSPGECRFPALPRAHQRNGWIRVQALLNQFADMSL